MILALILASFVVMSFCAISFMVIDQYSAQHILDDRKLDD